jgi:hypothetical protein
MQQLLLCLLFLTSCVSQGKAIVEGTIDSDNLFPMVCALLYKNPATGRLAVICSATLVAPDTLITTAHCKPDTGNQTEPTLVTCDQSGVTNNPTTYPISNLTTFPNWRTTALDRRGQDDIAVVKLASPVSGAPVAILPGPYAMQDLYHSGGFISAYEQVHVQHATALCPWHHS